MDQLTSEIRLALQVERQWTRVFGGNDAAGIAEARSAGRKAGRALNVPVRTFQSDPRKRSDGRVVVTVVITQKPPEWYQDEVDEQVRRALSKRPSES